jgi:hypothetical protein
MKINERSMVIYRWAYDIIDGHLVIIAGRMRITAGHPAIIAASIRIICRPSKFFVVLLYSLVVRTLYSGYHSVTAACSVAMQ